METSSGKVIKRHSDFIYVKSAKFNNEILECKVRERLKKEKTEIFVGDRVKIEEINPESGQAVITEVFERDNSLSRPAVANVDLIIAVASLFEPELNYIQLNRYLCLAKLRNIPAIICVNKTDLGNIPENLHSIYEPLGYKIISTSAVDGSGVDDLKNILKNRISVLAGMSGVGKSSLLNRLRPELNLKTGEVSSKTGRGTHTTRHVELIEIDQNTYIADTPGFSYLKFDNIMPQEVQHLFDEIKAFSGGCYFSDCLHLREKDCNVLNNSDKINETRYKSYQAFVEEAFEYKKKLTRSGKKTEEPTKLLDGPDKKKTRLIKLGKKAVKKDDIED